MKAIAIRKLVAIVKALPLVQLAVRQLCGPLLCSDQRERLMKLFVAACVCALTFSGVANAETLLFDFGRNTLLSPEAPNVPAWNNVLRPATGGVPLTIVNSQGDPTSVGLVFTDPFYEAGPPSTGGSESPSGDAAVYPVPATDDYFFGHTGDFAGEGDNSVSEFTLFGLDANSFYDFTFFSSRTGVGDNRDTVFEVDGDTSGNGLIASAGNDSEVLVIADIVPTLGGTIDISVSGGPLNSNAGGLNFYYLNLMQIDVRPIPEPSSVLLLLGGVASVFAGARSRG